MSQIEAPKVVAGVTTGADTAAVWSPKLIMYAVLIPGDPTPGDTTSQGHVYVQIVEA